MPSVQSLRTGLVLSQEQPHTTREQTPGQREISKDATARGSMNFFHQARVTFDEHSSGEARYKEASMPQEWFNPFSKPGSGNLRSNSQERRFTKETTSITAARKNDRPTSIPLDEPDYHYKILVDGNNKDEGVCRPPPESVISDSGVATAEAVQFYRISPAYINEASYTDNRDQLCQCPTPAPAKTEGTSKSSPSPPRNSSSTVALPSTAKSSLAFEYPHLMKVSRYNNRLPKTPPARLSSEHRPDTAFSFQRPLTPTPFASRMTTAVLPEDPKIYKRVSAAKLELDSLIPAMNNEIERTLWHEERYRVKCDTSDMVKGSLHRKTVIRYDDSKTQTQHIPTVDAKKDISKPKKTSKFRWWRFRIFRKKAPQNFQVLRTIPSTMSIAAKTLKVQSSIATRTLAYPPTPPTRTRARPRISALGYLPADHAPTTPSPLRQAQRLDSTSTKATIAQRNEKAKRNIKEVGDDRTDKKKPQPLSSACVKKRPWWRISLRPRVHVDGSVRNKMIATQQAGKETDFINIRGATMVTAAQHAAAHEGSRCRGRTVRDV